MISDLQRAKWRRDAEDDIEQGTPRDEQRGRRILGLLRTLEATEDELRRTKAQRSPQAVTTPPRSRWQTAHLDPPI